jgi:dipeptidyl aminopeptidase/acylaminoacyl peptidase
MPTAWYSRLRILAAQYSFGYAPRATVAQPRNGAIIPLRREHLAHSQSRRDSLHQPPITRFLPPTNLQRTGGRSCTHMNAWSRVSISARMALCVSLAGATGTDGAHTGSLSATCITLRGGGPKRVSHGMSPEDIVSIREIADQEIAPDGNSVAFVVRHLEPGATDYRSTIYLVAVGANRCPRVIAQEANIRNLRWVPNASEVSYLAPRQGVDGIVIRPLREGHAMRQVGPLPPISAFEWSPDGTQIALLATDGVDSLKLRHLQAEGILYSSKNTADDLITQSWLERRVRLIKYSALTHRIDTLWTSPTSRVTLGRGAWSSDSRYIAMTYLASRRAEDANNYDVGMVEAASHRFRNVVSWPGIEDSPVWAATGHGLVFRSQGEVLAKGSWLHFNTLYAYAAENGATAPLGPAGKLSDAHPVGWSLDGTWLIYDRAVRGAGTVSAIARDGAAIRTMSLGTAHLSECSIAPRASRLSCIRQDLTSAPEIAILDLQSHTLATVTDLNPELTGMALGEGNEIRWSNKFGQETNGFLFKPVNFEPGKRYPFLLVLYNFEQKFSAQAQWIPNYPVQSFAAAGFIVLLMNYPEYRPFRWGEDHDLARFNDQDNPVASIEAAVDTLISMGFAEPDRGGIMGWSMGSYWTDLAVTRTKLFQAASGGETGWRFPSTYWLGDEQWRYLQSALMGGPPTGASLWHYLQSAPSLLGPPNHIPTMHEFAASSLYGLEYVLWWEQGASMDLVFYPDEEHVFSAPSHRLSSMRRNLDWFRFWLQGAEDSDPSKLEQYQRWRAMRAQLELGKAPRASLH